MCMHVCLSMCKFTFICERCVYTPCATYFNVQFGTEVLLHQNFLPSFILFLSNLKWAKIRRAKQPDMLRCASWIWSALEVSAQFVRSEHLKSSPLPRDANKAFPGDSTGERRWKKKQQKILPNCIFHSSHHKKSNILFIILNYEISTEKR